MSWFSRTTRYAEWVAAHPLTSLAAWLTVAAWLAGGPFFRWSDTWQLVINSITNITTFLVVFMIQSTQSRDTQAIHVKLDEVLHALGRPQAVDIEDRNPQVIQEAKDRE